METDILTTGVVGQGLLDRVGQSFFQPSFNKPIGNGNHGLTISQGKQVALSQVGVEADRTHVAFEAAQNLGPEGSLLGGRVILFSQRFKPFRAFCFFLLYRCLLLPVAFRCQLLLLLETLFLLGSGGCFLLAGLESLVMTLRSVVIFNGPA